MLSFAKGLCAAALLALIGLAWNPPGAEASNCSPFTYTLTNGQVADANQVMANFNTLLNCANNNLAHNGANSDITSLAGLTTAITVAQGGTGLATLPSNSYLIGNGTSTPNSITVFYPHPQGRLTLQSGSPVQTTNESGVTTIYYDAGLTGNNVLVGGASPTILPIGSNEISMGLDAVTPHIASGSLYDIFAVNNSGTLVICAGPAWSTATSRGTGASTTQLVLYNGLWTNAVSITHCYGGASGTTDYGAVGVSAGTYLGTFLATANGQTSQQFNLAAATGGSTPVLGLWNAYNQVQVAASDRDSTASWTYAVSAWRKANASSSNRVRYIDGLAQSPVVATYGDTASPGSAVDLAIGLERDWSSGNPTGVIAFSDGATDSATVASNLWPPSLGLHEIDALENNNSTTSSTYVGASSIGQAMQLLVSLGM